MADENRLVPAWLSGALQVLAGAAGAAAIFGGAASLAGWQYTSAYYREIGIAPSVLEFSTRDYAFRTIRPVEFIVFGIAAAGLGILLVSLNSLVSLAIRWIRDEWHAYKERWDNARGLAKVEVLLDAYKVRNVLLAYAPVILLTAVAFAVWGAWSHADDFFGGGLGRPFLVALTATMLVSAAFTLLYRAIAHTREDRTAYLLACSVAFLFVIGGVLVFAARFIGEADGNRDITEGSFTKATFVVRGSVGGGENESAVPVTGGAPLSDRLPCPEYGAEATDAVPVAFCAVPNVLVILKNHGNYFVVPRAQMGAASRTIFVIPEPRIVRVTFQR